MKEWLKRVLPTWVKYLCYRLVWDPVRRAVWSAHGLECRLRSGVRVQVLSKSDWVIYNEVIVNGEYDGVIRAAVDASREGLPMRIVDLGANVGYFSFRFADLFHQRFGFERDFRLTLVEGSPAVFADLERRVGSEALLRDRTSLVHGLVGRREGGAYMQQGYIHYGYGVSSIRSWGAKFVSYVDLAEIIRGDEQIDLLKCDIEGAEFDLIANFPSVLANVRTAVFEFHDYVGNVGEARRLLRECGFRHHEVISSGPPCSVEFFSR